MGYEKKPCYGSLFKNNKKTNDSQPVYTGNGMSPKGEEFYISAWIKQDKNGNNYMSLKFEDPKAKEQKPEPKKEDNQDNTSLPF